MRNFISTAILCLLVLAGIAQNNDFVFYTDNGDKFTLYLNNVKQNATAATNVKAENISGKSISVRVVFERSGVPTFSRTMSVSSNDKERKVQLVKGRENVYTMKTVSTTDRHHSSSNNNSTTVVKGSNGSNETKDNGHGGNGGHGNNNGGHGNNNGGHGNNGHGNGGHGNGGYGNNNHGNGGYGNNGYWNNGYGPTDNPRCHFPMQQNDFNSLRSQVRARYFDSSRMTVAKQACRYNCMTSDQIRDLCKEFAYESNRLDFAKYAFEYCYDRYRYYIVGQAFTYSSSVDQLNRYITNQMANYQQPYGGYNNGGYFQSDNPNCHYIMSDHDFSDLRQMINNTPYSSTKMTIAKQACSATCISAEQVREICRLFTFDSDRLTFAKYAYDHCYDRRNYFKVNEVFTFSSSVSELNRYINQHNY